MNDITTRYRRDMVTWEGCAHTYEKQIVGGHPDIVAFEQFEEDVIDRILYHLATVQERPIKLMDIGCGSGRLHKRYALKSVDPARCPPGLPTETSNAAHPEWGYDPTIAGRLIEVWGVDFSSRMLALAREKVRELDPPADGMPRLTFTQGSAFDLEPEGPEVLPVAVCLINSIGVMQGPIGAIRLFQSMRRAVESAGGVALICAYRKRYLESHGLGQYETTMDVSGQPHWLVPDTYASARYLKIPREYRRAYSPPAELRVEVLDRAGKTVCTDHVLTRDPSRTRAVLETGQIRTDSDYRSNWYSFDLFEEWIRTHWPRTGSRHVETRNLDRIRAEPGQMALLDCGGHLDELLKRWTVA